MTPSAHIDCRTIAILPSFSPGRAASIRSRDTRVKVRACIFVQAAAECGLTKRLNETVKESIDEKPVPEEAPGARAGSRHRAAHPRCRPRRVRAPRHGGRAHAGNCRGSRRQPGAPPLLLPKQGSAVAGGVRARGVAVHADGDSGARLRRGARGEGDPDHRARARSPRARAVPAGLHHQRGHAPSRARASAHRQRHRPGAGRRAAAGRRDAAQADRCARQEPQNAPDRARAIRRQPDGAVHLSIRGAADDRGDARHGSAGLRAVHRAATSGSPGVLSWSVAAMSRALRGSALACLIVFQASAVRAQEPLQLATLQREALDTDPRVREFALQTEQSGLRLRNIEVERRPALSALGQAQYQSDVPRPPSLVGGQPLFSPPKDTYDVSVRVDQRIFDPALQPRLALARADLAESQARLRVALFGLRDEVNDAFFTSALLQEQIGALAATLVDLDTRLRETTVRVREGAALAGEAAAIEATLLQQRQQDEELRANRGAALARLARLTGRTIGADAVLALPALDEAVAQARRELDGLRARPEYEQFARARDKAARQQDLSAAAERPQLSAFGRAGVGKPGLNFISDHVESYALAGVQLQWKAWTWGTAGRERDALKLQQEVVSAEEAAVTQPPRPVVQADLAPIGRRLRAPCRARCLRQRRSDRGRRRCRSERTTRLLLRQRRGQALSRRGRRRHRRHARHAGTRATGRAACRDRVAHQRSATADSRPRGTARCGRRAARCRASATRRPRRAA